MAWEAGGWGVGHGVSWAIFSADGGDFSPETEDNMNCHMQNITMTGRDGKTSKLEYVYIRGSKMRFMIMPDMLKVRVCWRVRFAMARSRG